MKKQIIAVFIIALMLSGCSMNNVNPLDDGNVDLSKIENGISSQIVSEQMAKQPKTITSYNNAYTLTLSRKWVEKQKGSLSKNENSLFECVMYSGDNINASFNAVEYFTSAQTQMETFLSGIENYEQFLTEKNTQYVVFSKTDVEDGSKAGYYVFFIQAGDNCVQLMAKCKEVDIASYKAEFESIADSFQIK